MSKNSIDPRVIQAILNVRLLGGKKSMVVYVGKSDFHYYVEHVLQSGKLSGSSIITTYYGKEFRADTSAPTQEEVRIAKCERDFTASSHGGSGCKHPASQPIQQAKEKVAKEKRPPAADRAATPDNSVTIDDSSTGTSRTVVFSRNLSEMNKGMLKMQLNNIRKSMKPTETMRDINL
jgi:hypothetical protein